MRGTKRAAEPDPSSSSSSSKARSTDATGGGDGGDSGGDSDTGGGGSLADIEETVQGAVTLLQGAFEFLDGPTDVLSAATACRRWHELTRADSVWRTRFEREGLAEKACLFEVALPVVVNGGGAAGGGGSSSSSAAEEVEDALAGVGLAFYAQVFALKGYKMRDEDWGASLETRDSDGDIYTAVKAWCEDPAAAKAKYGPIASWDTSGVTDMDRLLFDSRGDFNEDISRWNVSNVVNMNHMFRGATSFNGDLSSWDVGQVKSMNRLFDGATSFNGDLSQWQVGQVKDMSCMFDGATSFNGDLSRWQVGQVKDMSCMFDGATLFNGDLSGWDVGQVEYMNFMFHGATSFARQLSGAWSTTTAAGQLSMFGGGCPGSIV